MYKRTNAVSLCIFYAAVGEGYVMNLDCGKTDDPMLKLYYGRPVMINDNIDIKNCITNGTMSVFQGGMFKKGVQPSDLKLLSWTDTM